MNFLKWVASFILRGVEWLIRALQMGQLSYILNLISSCLICSILKWPNRRCHINRLSSLILVRLKHLAAVECFIFIVMAYTRSSNDLLCNLTFSFIYKLVYNLIYIN